MANIWTKNAILFDKTGKSGKCPICGSNKVTTEKQTYGYRYSVTFTCLDCGAFAHFDGIDKEKYPFHTELAY